MARVPRFCLVEPESTNHCTWRAHDLEHVFEEPGARERFLELLGEHKPKHGVRIHSYCLMGTHPHVVCTSDLGQVAFSKFWQVVNYRFARWYNRRRKRRGQVVMERLRSPRIQGDGAHQLTVMRYGDLNPVRAGLSAARRTGRGRATGTTRSANRTRSSTTRSSISRWDEMVRSAERRTNRSSRCRSPHRCGCVGRSS